MSKLLTVRVDEDFHNRVKTTTSQHGVTIAEIVRNSLEDWMAKNPSDGKKKKKAAPAKAKAATTKAAATKTAKPKKTAKAKTAKAAPAPKKAKTTKAKPATRKTTTRAKKKS